MTAAPNTPLLEVRGLTVTFGGLRALDSVDVDVRPGAIHALIGPNGSGKSTFVNALTGFVRARGAVSFRGRSLLGAAPHRIFAAGIARTFQTPRLFPSLNVVENVLVALHAQHATRTASELRRCAMQQLELAGLAPKAECLVARLTAAERRHLEIARACAAGPRLLLLDEPAAGMIQTEREELVALFRRIRDGGAAILLIEHDLKMVTGTADCVTALNFGKKIAEGAPGDVAAHPAVVEAYLGKAAAK